MGVWKTENRFKFGFKETKPSKNLRSIQMVLQHKLRAIVTKLTLVAFNVQIQNVLKHY